MSDNPAYVIGSGPAGTAAARALLDKGVQVVMVDSGGTLEPERRAEVRHLADREPPAWTAAQVAAIKGDLKVSRAGVKEKKIFGSSFASRPSAHFPVDQENCRFYLSFAKGGLSNLWGRGILPLSRQDAEDWPFDPAELHPYYRKVFEFVPLAGRLDDLSAIYPLHGQEVQNYRFSSQSQLLLDWFERNRRQLVDAGVHFGATRLAASMNDCRYCGLCMYGCPYDILYCSTHTLASLAGNKRFRYLPGLVVDSLEERHDGVILRAVQEVDGIRRLFHADRVYTAAGSVATTRIMLKSLGLVGQRVTLKCSDLYYLPALSFRGGTNVVDEELFTLSQLMLEIKDETLSRHFISIHLHGYNDIFLNVLKGMSSPFSEVLMPLMRSFLNRFLVLFCFLHSDHSASLDCHLSSDGRLMVQGRDNPASRDLYRKLRKKLIRLAPKLGLMPIPFYARKRLAGTSMHFGGSFPMRKCPSKMQTDFMGRPTGMHRVHLVDASVLPTIPAGSYTLTVMANAYRIGMES